MYSPSKSDFFVGNHIAHSCYYLESVTEGFIAVSRTHAFIRPSVRL